MDLKHFGLTLITIIGYAILYLIILEVLKMLNISGVLVNLVLLFLFVLALKDVISGWYRS